MRDQQPGDPAAAPAGAGVPAGAPTGALQDCATLRGLTRRLREGLYVADAEGRLLDASAALLALAGVVDADALRGRRMDDLVLDPRRRAEALAGLTTDAPGRSYEAEVVIVASDGRRRAVVESVTAERDASGVTRLLGVIFPLEREPGESVAPSRDEAGGSAATGAVRGTARDALTGCLSATHLNPLAERLGRDPTASVGVIVVRLEPGRDASSMVGLDGEGPLSRDDQRQLLARFLMRHVRGHEPVLRLDDDEFLVVLGAATTEVVERVARRVQLLGLRGAPGALSLGWAARERGESLPGLVSRAKAARVAVPVAGRPDDRRHLEHAALTAAVAEPGAAGPQGGTFGPT
jgi:GGDEF domain-containing protein